MTRAQMIDLAVQRGFRKLYPYGGKQLSAMRFALRNGRLFKSELRAVLSAWDGISYREQAA